MLFPTPLLNQKGIRLQNLGDAMDTMFVNEKDYKKMIETAVNVSVIGVLILCQGLVPIHAGNVRVAQVTAPDFDTGQIKMRILNEFLPNPQAKF